MIYGHRSTRVPLYPLSQAAWLKTSGNSPRFPCHSWGKGIFPTKLLCISFCIVFHIWGSHFLFRAPLLLHQLFGEVRVRIPLSWLQSPLSHIYSLSLPSPQPSHTYTAQRNTLLSPSACFWPNILSIPLNTNLLPFPQNSQNSPEGSGFSMTNVRKTSRLFLNSALHCLPWGNQIQGCVEKLELIHWIKNMQIMEIPVIVTTIKIYKEKRICRLICWMRATSHPQGVCGKLPQHPSSQFGKVNPTGSFLLKAQVWYTNKKQVELYYL